MVNISIYLTGSTTNAPVSAANVSFYVQPSASAVASSTTDYQGSTRVNLAPGSYLVKVTLSGTTNARTIGTYVVKTEIPYNFSGQETLTGTFPKRFRNTSYNHDQTAKSNLAQTLRWRV